MKKRNKLIALLFIFFIICLVILMYSNSTETNVIKFRNREYLHEEYLHEKYLQEEEVKDYIPYIDYPLLEFYFLGDNNWDFIIENFDNDKYNLINDNEILESFKGNIVLNTFPVGRGNSSYGRIYLYKDSELVKKIPFIEIICIETSELSLDGLKNYTKQDIENICGYSIND